MVEQDCNRQGGKKSLDPRGLRGDGRKLVEVGCNSLGATWCWEQQRSCEYWGPGHLKPAAALWWLKPPTVEQSWKATHHRSWQPHCHQPKAPVSHVHLPANPNS